MRDKVAIKEFIENELMRSKKNMSLQVTDNLLDSGVIDSMGIQILVNYLESNFSISIADKDLTPDNFETVEAIWSLVNKS